MNEQRHISAERWKEILAQNALRHQEKTSLELEPSVMPPEQPKVCAWCHVPINDDDLHEDGLCDNCRTHPARKEFFENQRDLVHEISLQELIDILGSTIKKDNSCKVNVFLDMLLTYTKEDQQSSGLIAGSSTGKSWIPLQLAPYFPKVDVIKLGHASPTAFSHERGDWVRDPRLPPLMEGLEDSESDEDHRKRVLKEYLTVVDLRQKIVIFLDAPNTGLLQNLRSFIAHDGEYIEQRITDKSQKAGLRTKKVLLVGYATLVFCSANFVLDEQEKTRLNLYSPDIDQEKLREAIISKIHKDSDRDQFEKDLEANPRRTFLEIRVADIKRMNFKTIKISEELQAEIEQRFLENHKNLQPRHMRDIGRVMAKIKAFALLNYHNRKHDYIGSYLEVNHDDVDNGFAQYETYRESNELGLPPEAYNAYIKLEEHFHSPGITIDEYQQRYYEEFHEPLGRDKARRNLKLYTTVGVLYEVPDTLDKRKVRYLCASRGVPPSPEILSLKDEVPLNSNKTIIEQLLSFEESEKKLPLPLRTNSFDDSSVSRTCGECANFHKPSCGYPNGNFEVVPSDKYANILRCFKPQTSLSNTPASVSNPQLTGEDSLATANNGSIEGGMRKVHQKPSVEMA